MAESSLKINNNVNAGKVLQGAFDTATGHNHDGTNSRALTFPSSYSLASGKIIVGNASNLGAAVTPAGDVTISNTGATAIGANKVTKAMLASAISPAYIIRKAGVVDLTSGGVSTDVEDTSIASTDIVLVTIVAASNACYVAGVAITASTKFAITVNTDPGASSKAHYAVLRATE